MATKSPSGPIVNTFNFDNLIRETLNNAGALAEFFRLNLIYYELISGRGLEFEKVKIYTPGDDVKRLDWKIFAKTGKLYTRVFKEERTFNIIIILDVSNSMLLGTNQYTKNEFGAMVAGTLAYAAVEAGDPIGGGTFSHEKQGLAEVEGEYFHFMNNLTIKENYGGTKNWGKLVNTLLGNYDEDSIVFIISDFIDTKPEIFLPELTNQFVKVYGIMVRDPIDEELPRGVGKMYLRDPHTGRMVLTDVNKVRKEYEIVAKAEVKHIKETFRQYGQTCFKITTGENFGLEFIKALGGETVEIY